MGDRDIIQDDIEFFGSLREDVSDLERDLLSLGQELICIVLGDHWLENFISNRRDNSLIIIDAKVIEDVAESLLIRAEQNSQGELNLLHVTGTSVWVNKLRSGPYLKDFRFLNTWMLLEEDYFLTWMIGI